MKLEVNEYYLNARGEIIKIIDNVIYLDFKDKDAIAHIPKSLHNFLIQQINDYHVDEDFRLTVESVYGK